MLSRSWFKKPSFTSYVGLYVHIDLKLGLSNGRTERRNLLKIHYYDDYDY